MWLAVPTLEALAGIAFAALATLTAAHGVARALRPPNAAPCRACEERRLAWERKHFWRILRSRVRRWWRGPLQQPTQAARSGACRSCGQPTPLEQMDAQPPAAPGLRHVVERSAPFARLAPRLAGPDPVDTWEADMLHYFVYELTPDATGRAAHALFVARWEDDEPVAASIFLDGAGDSPQAISLNPKAP
jgi:hypothetical protein